MGIRIEVQNRITELLKVGTFPTITYTDKIASEGVNKVPGSIVVNELAGGLADSAAFGATSFDYVIRDWRFEAIVEFDCEVATDYFMLNELRKLNFDVDNLLVTVVPSGDFQVTHPPRNAPHNGTKLTIGLTVNTRR